MNQIAGGAALASCALLATFANPACAAASPAPADVVFVNGHVVTLDAQGSVVEAVAVHDGRIVATDRNEQVQALAGPRTEVVDLQGRTALPGFVDGHAHAALDQAALDVPVMFLNGSHEAVVNSAGVRALGLHRNVRELKGAAIELDATGEPTGVVREGLMIFPDLRVPPDDLRRYYSRAIPELWNAAGYTSIYTLVPLDQLPVLGELAQGSPTTLRYTVGLHADPGGRFLPASLTGLDFPPTVDSTWYRLAGIKAWLDTLANSTIENLGAERARGGSSFAR